MLGSTALDVGLGLILVYLVLSLVCSAVNELVSSLFGIRARMLKSGIRRLLSQDAKTIKAFYDHPLVKSVSPGGAPSYLSSSIFAATVLDTAIDLSQGAPTAIDDLLRRVKGSDLIGAQLKRSLRTLLGDAKDIADARLMVARWFDEGMERVSGTYKRFTQATVFFIGAAVCALSNADTLAMANALWSNAALRAKLGETATNAANAGGVGDATDALRKLGEQQLLGWPHASTPVDLAKIVGIALTTFAVSLGAPFWFDLLGRFVRVRSSGAKPAAAPDAERTESD